MNYCYLFLNQINNDPINNSTGYLGPQSWVYYLIGAIFLVLAIVSGFFCYKYRNSKREFENIADSYHWFKKFWLLNRFTFLFMITLILLICSVIFFLMNSVFLNGNQNTDQNESVNMITFLLNWKK
ncbi:hypothetical protein [Malacoplasma iowae]|uniref:Uncharacterized protein n=1 Tax=Malacoplasma iowae 695 TaxID=1048830 RepID=A0A6P1LIK0_MALIO|nr:hypothetical protein [Malacoplasma iowae]VEU61613.1 Uncharacterised protein [Mycoplasmopsis fermentans]EGZ30823.1 hypothetical protein GUU_00307 [Malacoplasma iowae 695]QHG90241.1 hypothetical protein EER00_05185 [Malacoplasma iowae 695]WPL36006.1 hypothetical protein QX180_01100 [Malacoplasma iowae]WPL40279.1 hypothetical protein QX183_01845 [Malacoplasma iowae]